MKKLLKNLLNGWTLLNNWDEWHAFVVGFCECFPPWKPFWEASSSYKEQLADEYHYYAAGRVVGFVILLAIIIAVVYLLRQ